MTSKKLPIWFDMTMRQWRQEKRKDLKNLIAAVEEMRRGIWYVPFDEWDKLDEIIKNAKKSLSVKNWGR